MRQRYSKSANQVITAGLLYVSVSLLGCSPQLPANWQKDIPGVYAGDQSGFREVIEFKSDGTFNHQVFFGGGLIHSESGKWRVPSGEKELVLEPFTQFYHRMDRAFSTNGVKFAFSPFWPLPDGRSFSVISASVDDKFLLVRGAGGSVTNRP
jgi:hypothetical protein